MQKRSWKNPRNQLLFIRKRVFRRNFICSESKKITIYSKFQDHLSNQESILQSTRGLHYVFQALFLGIGFAILAIGYSIVISIEIKNGWGNELVATALLITVCSFIIKYGKRFLKAYSQNVYKRGVVIDVLQHLRLSSQKNDLEELLGIAGSKAKDDIVFLLIKIVERIADDYGGKYRNKHAVGIVCNPKLSPLSSIVHLSRYELLIYMAFWGDIYFFDYPDFPIEWHKQKLRIITPTRNGHKDTFEILWILLIILLLVLVLFLTVKIC